MRVEMFRKQELKNDFKSSQLIVVLDTKNSKETYQKQLSKSTTICTTVDCFQIKTFWLPTVQQKQY
jgi:hypothetical protein